MAAAPQECIPIEQDGNWANVPVNSRLRPGVQRFNYSLELDFYVIESRRIQGMDMSGSCISLSDNLRDLVVLEKEELPGVSVYSIEVPPNVRFVLALESEADSTSFRLAQLELQGGAVVYQMGENGLLLSRISVDNHAGVGRDDPDAIVHFVNPAVSTEVLPSDFFQPTVRRKINAHILGNEKVVALDASGIEIDSGLCLSLDEVLNKVVQYYKEIMEMLESSQRFQAGKAYKLLSTINKLAESLALNSDIVELVNSYKGIVKDWSNKDP